jgi:hypothetical protein
MKGRQLLLSLTLLLCIGFWCSTSVNAQANRHQQISFEPLTPANPGDPLTLKVTPFNEYTVEDIKAIIDAQDTRFGTITASKEGGILTITMAEHSELESAQSQIAFLQNHLNVQVENRREKGIEKGPNAEGMPADYNNPDAATNDPQIPIKEAATGVKAQ